MDDCGNTAKMTIPVKTDKQVEAELAELEGKGEDLTDIILELEGRLRGVLVETDAKAPPIVCEVETPLVPIALRIYQAKRRIASAINQVRDILDRLELSG